MTGAELARQQIDGPLAIQAAMARQTAATLAVLAPFIRRLSEMVVSRTLRWPRTPSEADDDFDGYWGSLSDLAGTGPAGTLLIDLSGSICQDHQCTRGCRRRS